MTNVDFCLLLTFQTFPLKSLLLKVIFCRLTRMTQYYYFHEKKFAKWKHFRENDKKKLSRKQMIRTLELRDNQCDFPKLQFFRILEYFLQYLYKYIISNKIWTENPHEIFQYIVMKMGDSYELFSEIIYHKKSTYFVSVKGFLYYSQKKVPLIKKFKAFL